MEKILIGFDSVRWLQLLIVLIGVIGHLGIVNGQIVPVGGIGGGSLPVGGINQQIIPPNPLGSSGAGTSFSGGVGGLGGGFSNRMPFLTNTGDYDYTNIDWYTTDRRFQVTRYDRKSTISLFTIS